MLTASQIRALSIGELNSKITEVESQLIFLTAGEGEHQATLDNLLDSLIELSFCLEAEITRRLMNARDR